jgi:hypothetical protein
MTGEKSYVHTLIKNKRKFYSYRRKFRWDRKDEEGLPNIWRNTQIFNHTVYEEAVILIIYDFATDPF